MSDHLERLISAFESAVDLPTESRSNFLADIKKKDPALYDELVRLIEKDSAFDGILDGPIALDIEHRNTGEAVGPYSLVGELGRGGMGTVYKAVRRDREVEQYVAIKVSHQSLLSADLVRRFKTEQQILARLTHPNIVSFLDRGVTADKAPYYVMELIDGTPITAYCRDHNLDIDAKLRLFQQVCAAVWYAHQQLVVHRDLKPSNILVTPDGKVKLLDFGIAKIIDDDGSQTHTINAPITPEYASPEQILDKPISTASDIYTLGLLLYQILTDRSPSEIYGVTRTEISRGITEIDPQRPSSRSGDRSLKGDLDNIVMKALEKDPNRRYASVEQLSDDIGRYLDGYPVKAHPQSLAYKAAKFCRRNTLAVTIASVLLLLLVGTALVAFWQAAAAKREQEKAERNFAQVRKIATALIFDYHDEIAKLPGSVQLRARLVSDAVEYLDAVAANDTNDPDLLKELGVAYRKIGAAQGMVYSANLGKTDDALNSSAKSVQLLNKAIQLRPTDLTMVDELVASLTQFDSILARKNAKAFSTFKISRYAIELNNLAIQADPTNTDRRIQAIGLRILDLDNYVEADVTTSETKIKNIAGFRELLADAEKLLAENPGNVVLLNRLMMISGRLNNLDRWVGVRLVTEQGQPDLGRQYLVDSIADSKRTLSYNAVIYQHLKDKAWFEYQNFAELLSEATALAYLGRLDEAEEVQRTIERYFANIKKDDPNNAERKLEELAVIKLDIVIKGLQKNFAGVNSLAVRGLAVLDAYDKQTGSDSTASIETLTWRGYLLKQELVSLEKLNGDKARIAQIAARLKVLEQKYRSMADDFDGFTGITIG
ncbi:MAG: serine/threonine protein kinase [Acidobacteria bacterium ACB1]|nr:serine/threonine protein kinase [Acidobacteria bacterium ACB1]RIJ94538.1 MAG: hypothetical protein DCC44_04225 [Acidobacteriota bacterium]